MASQSPNLGLTLPIGSENVSRQIINDNNLIIDGAVESNSEALAIVINGDTAPKAITSGQYLFIKNHTTLPTGGYHATANIANGAAVTSSNVAQDADGIANALNGKIENSFYEVTYDTTTSGTGAVNIAANEQGHIYLGSVMITGGPGFVFRRDSGYLTIFNNNMQPIANTAVKFKAYYTTKGGFTY